MKDELFQETLTENSDDITEDTLETDYDAIDDQLIGLMKSNTILYDKNHMEYKNIMKKERAWQSIATSCQTTGAGPILIVFYTLKRNLLYYYCLLFYRIFLKYANYNVYQSFYL